MFEKYNKKSSTIREGVELTSLPFKPLKDLIGQSVVLDGFFFTKGRYGKQLVVVANGCKINMPNRAVEQFEEIAKNDEEVKAIVTGHCKMIDIKLVSTKNGNTTGYTLVDC